MPGSRRVDAKPQRGRGCCARTGADSQAHSFGEGARTSPSPARGSGLRAAGAGRLGREGGALGAVMVEEPAGAGRRTPTLRRTAAVRPGAPRQGAARRGAGRAGGGATAGTVGKPASSDPPHLGESSPPTPPAVQGPPRPPGVHLQLPSFAMLPFGDKTRYFLQHCPSLSQFSRGARWGRVLCWVVAPGSHWLGDALLKMRSLTFLSSFTFLQM